MGTKILRHSLAIAVGADQEVETSIPTADLERIDVNRGGQLISLLIFPETADLSFKKITRLNALNDQNGHDLVPLGEGMAPAQINRQLGPEAGGFEEGLPIDVSLGVRLKLKVTNSGTGSITALFQWKSSVA